MTEAFESTKNYLLSPSQAVRVSKVLKKKRVLSLSKVIEQSQTLLGNCPPTPPLCQHYH